MNWLILTDNQDKASRIREVLRSEMSSGLSVDATLISSRGLPWTVEVEVSPNELTYHIKRKDSYKEVLDKIEQASQEADRILLAFEPTTIGEATSWEFEKMLGARRCARYRSHQLDSKSIKETLLRYESLDNTGLPKANPNMAKAHWTQAVVDLTWASKVNEWLKNSTENNIRTTRLMGVVLKTIASFQRREKRYKIASHYELNLELKSCHHTPNPKAPSSKQNTGAAPKHTTTAKVIVPTLAQIGTGVGPKAREFWKLRLDQSREQSIKGWEIPQPEPGKPWRFHQHEEAKIHKQHIKKFPYFLVEASSTSTITNDIQCPPTNNNLHDHCAVNKIGIPEDVERSLSTLYIQGLISNPKSNFPSLNSQTIEKLYSSCKDAYPLLSNEPRAFHCDTEPQDNMEAIHPTNWGITPKNVKYEILRSKSIKLTQEEIKRAETLYELIYNWCIKSQQVTTQTTVTKHFVSGPLFLSRKQAQERQGQKFHISKEEPFHAHMTLLAMTDQEIQTKEGGILECIEVDIKEIKTSPPPILDQNSLLRNLCSYQAGKRDTIINILNFLKEKKMVAATKDIKLTPKGENYLEILESNFGQYLDTNYIKTLNNNMSLIERGRINDKEFLNYWWFSLRSFLQTHTEEEKVLQWKRN